jgi:hypothetical protein
MTYCKKCVDITYTSNIFMFILIKIKKYILFIIIMVVGMMYMRESCMSTLVDYDKCIGINSKYIYW